LTGGDPFVKKDIWEIIQYISEKDFALDIYTNGIALSYGNNVKRIANYYPRSIGISLYSGNADIHELITRRKGSFQRTLSAIQSLTDLAIIVMIKCPIMKVNVATYYKVADIAKHYGAIPQLDMGLCNSVDGDFSITENLGLTEDVLEIVLRDSRNPLYVGDEVPNYGTQHKEKDDHLCSAGVYGFNITPDGNVYPCNSLTLCLGNVNKETVTSIWYHSSELKAFRKITFSDTEVCGRLPYCDYCSFCVGNSWMEHGSLLKPNEIGCQLAKARMNVATMLQSGIDPIFGRDIQTALNEIEVTPQTFSKDMRVDYRDKRL
jgi:radical SAM protein with 4Fe4S-binding SPASM domain